MADTKKKSSVAAAIEAFQDDDGMPTVHRFQGGWLRYTRALNCFRPISPEQLEQEIYRALRRAKVKSDSGAISSSRAALKRRTYIDEDRQLPFWWRDREGDPEVGDVIVHRKGLFVVSDFLAGKPLDECIMPVTARLVTRNSLPYTVTADAACPTWLGFLTETFRGDDRERLLQEWAGYILTPDTSLQRSLWLVGAAAGGKGVIAETLCELVGRDNASATRLEDFSQNFALSAMVGAVLNWSDEASKNTKVAEDKLKALIGGATIQVDRKNQEPIKYKTNARLMVTCNEMPHFFDKSDGIWRRLMALLFDRSVPEEQRDYQLIDRLRLELPGIFLWSLQGLRCLRQQGRFTVPESGRVMLAEHRAASDPLAQFVADTIVAEAAAFVTFADITDAYNKWVQSQNYKIQHSASSIKREIIKQFPGAIDARPRVDNPTRRRGLAGVRLRRLEDPLPDDDAVAIVTPEEEARLQQIETTRERRRLEIAETERLLKEEEAKLARLQFDHQQLRDRIVGVEKLVDKSITREFREWVDRLAVTKEEAPERPERPDPRRQSTLDGYFGERPERPPEPDPAELQETRDELDRPIDDPK